MFQEYLSYRGRIGRLRFLKLTVLSILAFTMVNLVVVMIFFALALFLPLFDVNLIENSESQVVLFVFMFLASLPLYYCNLMFSIKRLHDLNLSGWWILLFILISVALELIVSSDILTYTLGALQFVLLLLVPGTDGPNRFGPKPGVPTNVLPSNGNASSFGTPA